MCSNNNDIFRDFLAPSTDMKIAMLRYDHVPCDVFGDKEESPRVETLYLRRCHLGHKQDVNFLTAGNCYSKWHGRWRVDNLMAIPKLHIDFSWQGFKARRLIETTFVQQAENEGQWVSMHGIFLRPRRNVTLFITFIGFVTEQEVTGRPTASLTPSSHVATEGETSDQGWVMLPR